LISSGLLAGAFHDRLLLTPPSTTAKHELGGATCRRAGVASDASGNGTETSVPRKDQFFGISDSNAGTPR
jgi:hypothetical protein